MSKERAFVDLTGRRFGRLLVLKVAGKDKQNKRVWECLCDCGNLTIVRGSTLVEGKTRSCGCYGRERAIETLAVASITHGKSADPVYYIWEGMKARCYNENSDSYSRYGGRGIKVCDTWLNSFEAFYKDMGDPPVGYTLDRVDNNGDYCKENCRWATASEQARNRSSCKIITLGGKTKPLIEWLEDFGMPRETYYSRIKSGLSPEQALLTPIDMRYSGDSKKRNLFTYNGKTQCVTVWSRESGIPASTLRQRIKKGYSPEQVMSTASFKGLRSLKNISAF